MDDLHKTVWRRLNEGYGVEDITVLDELSLESVRLCVQHFRGQGKLAQMYGRVRLNRRHGK